MNLSFWRELLDGLAASCLGETPELRKRAEELLQAPDFDGTQLEELLSNHLYHHAEELAETELFALTALGEENPSETILRRANGQQLDWMQDYGLPVREEEQALARFLFDYDPAGLAEIGNHIAKAFLHGFVSQSRQQRGRKRVRLHYCLGQEALAQQVVAALRQHGLHPVVQRPSCLAHSGSWALVHAADRAACLSQTSLAVLTDAYEWAYRRHSAALLDTCGMVGIGQFGEAAGTPAGNLSDYHPSPERRARLGVLENARRGIEARYLVPSDISFCKVAFPNLLVGESFPEVFAAFHRLNTMDSERYERIQQQLIDQLDCCVRVELVGAAGNNTKLQVVLRQLADPDKETNFLNCGGDLNIPHGELFTTPVLAGSNGVLHVREIYLKGVYFQDLTLTFRDGMLTDYRCNNFTDVAQGRSYIREHLLQNHDTLPMGEFAIGSNTLAYAIARSMQLLPRMPILLAEKMGPHIAIGDPCFARGEDAPVYNLYDGKEMTARENERTALRGTAKVYTNVHTDITLAFDELARLDGVREDGTRVALLKDGRFVLPGTEVLNEPL